MAVRGTSLLLCGVVVNYLQLVVAFLVNVVLTPIVLRYLGQKTYGLWVVFGSVSAYFMLFDLGLNTAVAKYTAEFKATGQYDRLSRTVSTTLVAISAAAAAILLISLGVVRFLPGLFNVPDELVLSAKAAFLLMGLNTALWLVSGVFGNVIYGHQRVDVWKAFSVVQLVINALLTVFMLRSGLGLIGVALAAPASTLLLLLLYLIFIYRSGYGITISPRLFQLHVLKDIAPYSLRTLVLGVTSRMLWYSGPIIIALFLGVAQVTPYDVVYKLCFYTTYLFSIISTVMFPRFSSLYAVHDLNGLRNLYLQTSKVTAAIGTLIAICLFFWGRSFIGFWVGEEHFAGMPVLILLIVMHLFHALGTPAAALLQGVGKNVAITYSEIISALLNVVFAVVLVPALGIVGVVVGLLLSHLLTSFWVSQWSVFGSTNLTLKEYLTSAILPPVAVGVTSGAAVYAFIETLLPARSVYSLVLNSGIVLVLYTLLFIVVMPREERIRYYRVLERD